MSSNQDNEAGRGDENRRLGESLNREARKIEEILARFRGEMLTAQKRGTTCVLRPEVRIIKGRIHGARFVADETIIEDGRTN
jgi:hypothetical protein